MLTSLRCRSARGFTLIELLIVVIILAILAAIVIPQFTNTTVDAKEATLDSNLSALRSAIELYKIQHNNLYPGATATGGGPACASGGAIGAAAIGTAQAFVDQMTAASDATGHTCTIADANYKFGPYLRQKIPNEPINNIGALAANIVVTSNAKPIVATAAGGWAYDTQSGQIVMNSTALDSKNVAYSTH